MRPPPSSGLTVAASAGSGQRAALEPGDGLGDARQVLAVAGELEVVKQLADVGLCGVRGQRAGLVAAGACGRTGGAAVFLAREVLQAPARLRAGLLHEAHAFHGAADVGQQVCFAQRHHAQREELDVLAHHVVVEGHVQRVVAVFHARLGACRHLRWVGQRHATDRPGEVRKTLRPAAAGHAVFRAELRVDHEVDGLLHGRQGAGLALFQVHAQQELRGHGRACVVKRGVAVVVLELLQTPAVLADGVVPLLQRRLSREVVDVVPAARRVLRGHDGHGGALGRAPVALVARGVVGVQVHMAHRRRARWLDPAHGAIGLHLAEGLLQVRRIRPHVATLVGHGVVHVVGGALERVRRVGLGAGRESCVVASAAARAQQQGGRALRVKSLRFIVSMGCLLVGWQGVGWGRSGRAGCPAGGPSPSRTAS